MIDITYGIWEVPGYDIYPACHSVLHKQLQNVYTRQKEKKKKIQIIKSGKYCKDLQRSKAACQLFVNVVYEEIKQGGKGAREREREGREPKETVEKQVQRDH